MNYKNKLIEDSICVENYLRGGRESSESQSDDQICSICLQGSLNCYCKINEGLEEKKPDISEIYEHKHLPKTNTIQQCQNKLIQKAICIKGALSKCLNSHKNKNYSKKLVQESVELPLQQTYFNKKAQKIKQVATIYTSTFRSCLAFNKSLILLGCEDKIRIFYFNNRKLLKQLSGFDDIQCLVLSKKWNWFLSSNRYIIGSWKLIGSDWIMDVCQKNQVDIKSLLLNNEENELISAYLYQPMMVWSVDSSQKLIFKYDMGQLSKGASCISLNQSETALITYVQNFGSQIKLWIKGVNNKWEYVNFIKVDFGSRLSFVSDTEIFFQLCNYNITKIFKLENRQLVLQNQTIPLENTDLDVNFDTMYNKKRQVIIEKHGQYVYIIKKQLDGRFNIVLQPIDCRDSDCIGSMTEDGEYLVIVLPRNDQIRVYKMTY